MAAHFRIGGQQLRHGVEVAEVAIDVVDRGAGDDRRLLLEVLASDRAASRRSTIWPAPGRARGRAEGWPAAAGVEVAVPRTCASDAAGNGSSDPMTRFHANRRTRCDPLSVDEGINNTRFCKPLRAQQAAVAVAAGAAGRRPGRNSCESTHSRARAQSLADDVGLARA